MRTHWMVVAAACAMAPGTARPQEAPRTPVGARDLTQPANVGLGPAIGTTEDQRSSTAEIVLEADTENRWGTLSYTRTTGSSHLRVTLKAPLDAAGEAVPLTLDGATAGTHAELSYSRLSWGAGGPSLREQDEFQALCQRTFGRPTCKSSEFEDPDDQAVAEDLLHLHDAVWFWAVQGTFGRNQHRYLDGALHPQAINRNDWAGKVHVGRYLGIGFLVASYSKGRAFLGAPARQLCQPIGDTGALLCRNAVLAAPVEDSHSVASLEVRRFLGRGIGLAPLVQRDFENDVTALVLPVYFLKNARGSLIGGARAGWRSDERALRLALFIGSAMTLRP